MKVCFLLTHVPNPRMNKRIEVFKNNAKTIVVCARRASQNIWEPAQNVEHIILDVDLPSSKHIIKRFTISQGFQRRAFNELEEISPDVIYAEGLDSLLIACKYKRNHIVKICYEVADLRESFIIKPTNFSKRIMTNIILSKEKELFKKVDTLVVTSPKFYEMHYKQLISREHLVFIPNSPDQRAFTTYKKKCGGVFTVGFIGGIRYLAQMKMLVDASSQLGFNVLFAGAGGTDSSYKDITEYCVDKSNVFFTGKYQYDKDIANLYGRVDCVYAVYDADNPNVRIALPNKLYESILCELPIIVARGTYLSELVEEWGIGISVSHTNVGELCEGIKRLRDDEKYYQEIVEACRRYKSSDMFCDSSKVLSAFVGVDK